MRPTLKRLAAPQTTPDSSIVSQTLEDSFKVAQINRVKKKEDNFKAAHQLDSVRANQTILLFSNLTSQLWEIMMVTIATLTTITTTTPTATATTPITHTITLTTTTRTTHTTTMITPPTLILQISNATALMMTGSTSSRGLQNSSN